jgi:hypothetical protein
MLTGITHMVLRLVEGFSERDDWASLESISEPYERAKEALAKNGFQENDEYMTQFRAAQSAALTSPDLTSADQVRVAKAIKDALKEIKGLGAVPPEKAGLACCTSMRRASLRHSVWSRPAVGTPVCAERTRSPRPSPSSFWRMEVLPARTTSRRQRPISRPQGPVGVWLTGR